MMGGSIWEFPVDEVVAAALLEAFGVVGVVADELQAVVRSTAATTAAPDSAIVRMLARALVGVMLLRRCSACFGSGRLLASFNRYIPPDLSPYRALALRHQDPSDGHPFVR
jgi:hypothetical protein